jgi:hypothetical protein
LRLASLLAAAVAGATGVAGLGGVGGVAAIAAAPVPGIAPAAASWSAPAVLGGCPASEAPWAVFPEDSPGHATGPGAVLWSTEGGCPGGARVLVAAIDAGGRPGAPSALRTGGGQGLALRGPLAVAGGPHGGVVLSASVSRPGAPGSARGLFTQGRATGALAPVSATGGPDSPIALATAYLGDVAIASPVTEHHGRNSVRLRVERHHANSFERAVPVSGEAAGAVESLRVALDYRSDALVAWSQGGAIYARELPASGRAHPIQRLAATAPDPRIAALISDDNRAILAWAVQRGAQTSIYLDISTAGVRFHRPVLLERFADPDGLRSPGDSPSLIRLSSESVILAWSGSETGHWVVHTAPIDLKGMRTIQTMRTPGADALLAALAAGPAGDALVLWTEPQLGPAGIANPGQAAIFAARGIDAYPGLSIFGKPEEVAPLGANSDPALAVDPGSDRALAVWRGAGGVIEYAIRSASAP